MKAVMRKMGTTEAVSGLRAFELPGASPRPTFPSLPISLAPGFSRVSGDETFLIEPTHDC